MSLITFLFSVVALFQPAAHSTNPQLQARLHAAKETVAPGGQTEVALELTLAEGWYLYHPIVLGTGLPTEVTWSLPDGVTTGELRFPKPVPGSEPVGDLSLEYLALKPPVLILATLDVDPDVAPGPLSIAATVRGLACKEACVPVQAQVSLTLPVGLDEAAPANGALFEKARAALPESLEQSDFLAGSRLVVSHTRVPLGGSAAVAAVLRVKDGYYVQDRDPGVKDLIGTRLFIESKPGITFDPAVQVWPEPQVQQVRFVGAVRKQVGEFLVQAPFEVDAETAEVGPVRLRVLIEYQACSDSGTCFPPTMAEGFVEFEVVPAAAAAVASSDPVVAQLDIRPRAAAVSGSVARAVSQTGLAVWGVFLTAFLGGVLLNIMPCVLPVISLKILGFVQQAHDDRRRIFRMGLLYAAGIMASFAFLAALMVTAGLAWGGYMQQPGFLIGLIAVVFAFALSLLGVYEFNLPGAAMGAAGSAAAREGYGGAFLSGILATALATPCVAPLLGSALGLLARMPWWLSGPGIMLVGLGLAAPYVLLTAFPGWLRFVPKPGQWMVVFKEITGLIFVVVVLWLLYILAHMVPQDRLLATIGLLVAVSLACWLLGKISLTASPRRAVTIWATAVLLLVGGGWTSFRVFETKDRSIPWQDWEPGVAERLAAEGYTVYVDYTAAWCLTCQWNKITVMHTDDVAAEFRRLGIYPIIGDFTRRNDVMQEEIQAYGRNGVPTNVILPAGKPDQPIVLPELLRAGAVIEALRAAGPSRQSPGLYQ
jgi:thiol:disulfide interchange protein DsbD